ncbi:hypothetical protein PWT90_04813 [Aphanocladium album]|nr:hypothetical protein PWT90_04813 [Aphanocladium album]
MGSATSSPSSILDRKRELKAMPGSFSYNLGRRDSASPPHLDLAHGISPSRSVKSIVAWIESSARSKPPSSTPTSDDGASILSSASSCKLPGGRKASPARQHQLPAAGIGVDRDCPTFLDYQKYFSQGSLARCLDDSCETVVSDAETKLTADTKEISEEGNEEEKNGNDCSGEEAVVVEKRSSVEVAAL